MNAEQGLLVSPSTTLAEYVPPVVPTPMLMLSMAVQRGATIEELKMLLDLRDRIEADEARKAFVAAMSAFKSHSIVVTKDKENHQYKSKYTTLGNLVATVTPYLSQHNLSARWDIDQTAGIKVTCFITHAQGHSESVAMTCPPDKSGAKNPIQEIKSAITYAKACTFESICGLASTDANQDDDGNGYDNGELSERLEWIENSRNIEELQKMFGPAYKSAKAANNQRAMQELTKAYNAKKVSLTKVVNQ